MGPWGKSNNYTLPSRRRNRNHGIIFKRRLPLNNLLFCLIFFVTINNGIPKNSAGLLMYREKEGNEAEVFLVHPGGPLWEDKDNGVWSIPKGEVENEVNLLEIAKREFEEETCMRLRVFAIQPILKAIRFLFIDHCNQTRHWKFQKWTEPASFQ